jgi:Cu-processing system permease protein
MGKFLGHVIILFLAIFFGYGGVIIVMTLLADGGSEGWQAYGVMMLSSLILGAAFIALGYLVSVLVRERATAAGAAIGLWLVFVVLYDLILFGALLIDEGQVIGQQLFSMLMLVSPTDSYRILNLGMSAGVSHAAGIAGVASNTGMSSPLLFCVMILWVVVPLTAALWLFHRREL